MLRVKFWVDVIDPASPSAARYLFANSEAPSSPVTRGSRRFTFEVGLPVTNTSDAGVIPPDQVGPVTEESPDAS